MRIVLPSWPKDIVKHQPLLLLNKTYLSLSLIDSDIHCNASFVTTKQNITAFPLELWIRIIEFALKTTHKDNYNLVKPRAVQREEEGPSGYVSEQVLICDEYKQKVKCGQMPVEWLDGYDSILNDAESYHKDIAYYVIPVPEPTGEILAVSLGVLRNQKKYTVKVLFVHVDVPDMIARVEKGRCGSCDRSRFMCPGCERWVPDMFAERSLGVAASRYRVLSASTPRILRNI